MNCAACGYALELHEGPQQRCPGTKAARYKVPPPVDTALWPEIMLRDVQARFQAMEDARAAYVPPVVPPPQVAARPLQAASEIAGYGGRQAVGMGRTAGAAGWAVDAYYWRAHDGTEGCAIKLWRDDLRAVATWTRKPGNVGKTSGWAADIAYGWRLGTMPAKISHTDLERIINEQ